MSTAPETDARITALLRRTLNHAEALAREVREALGLPSVVEAAYQAGAKFERARILSHACLLAAVQHPAVTGTLAMLDSQGGGPADLASALLEALRDQQPAGKDASRVV